MADEKTTIDAALRAFNQFKAKGRQDVKSKIEHVKALQEAMKADAARLRATEE